MSDHSNTLPTNFSPLEIIVQALDDFTFNSYHQAKAGFFSDNLDVNSRSKGLLRDIASAMRWPLLDHAAHQLLETGVRGRTDNLLEQAAKHYGADWLQLRDPVEALAAAFEWQCNEVARKISEKVGVASESYPQASYWVVLWRLLACRRPWQA